MPSDASPTPLQQFVAERVEPRAAQTEDRSGGPTSPALLRAAMERCRVQLRTIEGSTGTLIFAGLVVGGVDGHLTTLVSAYGREVAGDPELTRGHLALRKLPVPGEDHEPAALLPVEVFVVGGTAVSAVLRVPPYRMGSADSATASATVEGPDTPSTDGADRAGRVEFAGDPVGERWTSGTAVDVLDELGRDVIGLACDAAAAVPGLGATAVRVGLASLGSARGAVVESLAPEAEISAHENPQLGTPRAVSDAIVERILERASK